MRYVWDYTHEYLDEKRISGIKKFFADRIIHSIRIWDKVAADRPDFYVANSVNVKRRIAKYFGEKSFVIYPPVDVDRFSLSSSDEDYFLIVSALTAFKKLDLAISLFNKLGKKLVIIGGGEELAHLKAIAGPTVDVLGYKDDVVVAE